MDRVMDHLQPYEAGSRLLTDDKAPVELLGMSVIDGIISRELGYYQDLFRENGITGVLDQLN